MVAWRDRSHWPHRRTVVPAVGAVLGLVALSQFFFYRGEVFKKCRYDFPFVPVVCVLLLGLLVAASQWRQGGPLIRRLRRRLLVPGTLAVLALAIGGDHSRAATHTYVTATTTFSDTIQKVARDCRGAARCDGQGDAPAAVEGGVRQRSTEGIRVMLRVERYMPAPPVA